MNKSLLLVLLLIIVACNEGGGARHGDNLLGTINPATGLPYLTSDAAKALESGASRQAGYIDAWRAERERGMIPPRTGSGFRCERPGENTAIALVQSYLGNDRRFRERNGNRPCACPMTADSRERCGPFSCPPCRCEPMGDTCLANSCSCDEICPAHHGVLAYAADRMNPDDGDGFAFINSNNYNEVAFTGNGVGDGMCTGLQLQRRKWAALADFNDTAISYPSMTVGDDTWKSFMRAQIDRMVDGLNPHFMGISKLSDLNAHPEIARYYAEKTGRRVPGVDSIVFGEDSLGEPTIEENRGLSRRGTLKFTPPGTPSTVDQVGNSHPEREVKVYFDQEGVTNITGHTEKDHSTNPPTLIPSMHERENFNNFIINQTRRVSRGEAAIIPGFANIHAISNQPTYARIITTEARSDWQNMNLMDDRMGRGDTNSLFHGNADFNMVSSMAPNGPDNNDHLLEQLRSRVPVLGPDQSMVSGAGPWNAGGPFQGASLEFMAFDHTVNADGTAISPAPVEAEEYPIPADIKGANDDRSFYHSVEVYALHEQSDGSVEVCLSNPNDLPSNNQNCLNNMVIPAPDASGRRTGRIRYPGNRELQVGRVELGPSSDAYQAQITSDLIGYCRRKNTGRSNCGAGGL